MRISDWSSDVCSSDLFLRMFRHREAAQITYHHQDVLIHGVGMEQVVLHLPHNTPEYGEVAGQDVHHGHASQSMYDPAWLLQYLDELAAIDRVAPELRVTAATRMPQDRKSTRLN